MQNQVLAKFDPVKSRITALAVEAGHIHVTCDESKEKALFVGKEMAQIEKKAEATYKEVIKDADTFIKTVREYKKGLVEMTSSAKSHLKSELLKYEKLCAQMRAEAAAKLAEEKRKAEEEARALAAKDVTPQTEDWDDWTTPEELQKKRVQNEMLNQMESDQFKAQKEQQFRAKEKEIAETRVKGTTVVWNFKITDEKQLPRDFLMVDTKKIREFMRDTDLAMIGKDVEKIPGIEFFQETRMSLR